MVNIKPAEQSRYKKLHSKILYYNSLLDIKNSPVNATLFLEDIIHLTTKEEILLRYYLNEFAHHRKLKIFCVGHLLYKTSLYGVASLFNFIVYSACTSNIPLLKQTLQVFAVEPDRVSEYLEKFQVFNNHNYYYYFNCENYQFKLMYLPKHGPLRYSSAAASTTTTTTKGKSSKKQKIASVEMNEQENFELEAASKKVEKQLVERGKLIFEDHPAKNKALSLLSIIGLGLPSHIFRLHDLTVSFYRKSSLTPKNNNGTRKNISLIDYIEFLLRPTKKSAPDQNLGETIYAGSGTQRRSIASTTQAIENHDFKVLHNFVISRCELPKTLILNKNV